MFDDYGTIIIRALELKMLSAIAARDAIGDRAFEEGREPMTDEWAMMKEQQRKHDS